MDCASTNYKPALKGEVDASVTSRRRGCIKAAVVYVNPSVTAYAVPAPRPGSLLGATTNQKLSPFTGKVDANAMSRRKGCIGAALVFVNPSVKPSACQFPVKGSRLGMVLTQNASLP